jgi:abortive infection bacteriophage resistance protein
VRGASFRFGANVSHYRKPFLTIPQQIALLQSRGMKIDQPQQAEDCLQRVGYYRLSAYWYPFRQSRPDPSRRTKRIVEDDFQAGTTFTAVFDLYVFDKKLRLLMLDALERIEIAIRTDVALLLGARAPTAHHEPAELHSRFTTKTWPRGNGRHTTDHQEWLRKLTEVEKRSSADFVEHFRKKYPSSRMPIWISTELWDFGMLSWFVGGMMSNDQIALASRYNIPRGDLLVSWLRMLNFIRNICAHHARLWNQPLVTYPKMPKPGTVPLLDHVAPDRFYAAAAVTRYLLRSINPTTSWATRLKDLIVTFPANPCVQLDRAGFPIGWEAELLWK